MCCHLADNLVQTYALMSKNLTCFFQFAHQVDSQQRGEVEGEVVAVGQLNRELLRLFEVGNVPEKNDALADEPGGVQGDPNGVAEPKYQQSV
jgi:hypothetical protein